MTAVAPTLNSLARFLTELLVTAPTQRELLAAPTLAVGARNVVVAQTPQLITATDQSRSLPDRPILAADLTAAVATYSLAPRALDVLPPIHPWVRDIAAPLTHPPGLAAAAAAHTDV
jgi:hypothetical protein